MRIVTESAELSDVHSGGIVHEQGAVRAPGKWSLAGGEIRKERARATASDTARAKHRTGAKQAT